MVPEFKQGDFTSGITSGLLAISGLVTKEFEITDEELAKYNQQQKAGKRKQIPFGLIVFLIMFIFGGLGRGRKRGGLFTALFLGSMLGGGSRSSSSGFGGGFGGFSGGGGSFGGGGASGGW